ncbi:MAG: DUF2007 domain-containing protein [Burkholderiales bacterium]|nr:DUF2007 domain-containing protein [Burkholderiales bacterium]
MKLLYASLSLHEAHHLMNLLRSCGIDCHLSNESLSTLAGEVPFTECSVRLYVDRDRDLETAAAVLRQWRAGTWSQGPAWRCPACGEQIEAQFTACWRCAHERPVATTDRGPG